MPVVFLIIIALFVFIALFFIVHAIMTPKRTNEIARLIEAEKYTAAIKLAKSIIEKNERNFLARYYLGRAYIANGRADLAMQEFQEVNNKAVFGPTFPEEIFRHDMAELYKQFEQPEEALKEYILLTKIEPKNAENYFEAGKLFELREKPEQALKYYKLATSTDSKYANAHLALGKLLIKQKQFADAKKEIDYTIKLSPDKYSSYYYLGKIMKEMKEYNAAVNAFEKASRDSDYRQKALLERGLCFMEVNHHEKAIPDLERAISNAKSPASPETLYARYFLASCFERNHNLEAAIKQWEAIKQVKRNFKDVAAKLNNYKDLQDNDNMKDYLTSSTAGFLELCQKIAIKNFNVKITASKSERFGCTLQADNSNEETGSNMRTQKSLFYFFRENVPVDDHFLRTVLEEMKRNRLTRCIICSSCGFTTAAHTFAEGRPFELVDKEKLNELLTHLD